MRYDLGRIGLLVKLEGKRKDQIAQYNQAVTLRAITRCDQAFVKIDIKARYEQCKIIRNKVISKAGTSFEVQIIKVSE